MTRETLIAIRPRVAQLGIATDAEVTRWNFNALFTTLLVELVAQIPG